MGISYEFIKKNAKKFVEFNLFLTLAILLISIITSMIYAPLLILVNFYFFNYVLKNIPKPIYEYEFRIAVLIYWGLLGFVISYIALSDFNTFIKILTTTPFFYLIGRGNEVIRENVTQSEDLGINPLIDFPHLIKTERGYSIILSAPSTQAPQRGFENKKRDRFVNILRNFRMLPFATNYIVVIMQDIKELNPGYIMRSARGVDITEYEFDNYVEADKHIGRQLKEMNYKPTAHFIVTFYCGSRGRYTISFSVGDIYEAREKYKDKPVDRSYMMTFSCLRVLEWLETAIANNTQSTFPKDVMNTIIFFTDKTPYGSTTQDQIDDFFAPENFGIKQEYQMKKLTENEIIYPNGERYTIGDEVIAVTFEMGLNVKGKIRRIDPVNGVIYLGSDDDDPDERLYPVSIHDVL